MLSQQEKLAFCKVCKNRSFSSDVGIIWGLTKRPPTFNETCVDYQEDVKQITRDFERKHSHKITQPSGKVTPVSAGTRFANYFIDGIIHTVLYYVVLFNGISSGLLEGPGAFLLRIILVVGYYVLLESTTGKTIGKMVTDTMVVLEDGSKPTTDKIVARSFSRLIPFNAFSFLFLNGVGWHDTISGTRVVSKNNVLYEDDNDVLDRF